MNDMERKIINDLALKVDELKDRVKELEKMNARLTKGIDVLMRVKPGSDKTEDVRLKLENFIAVYDAMHSSDFENEDSVDLVEEHVYGHNFTVHWHGFYVDCCDGAVACNYIEGALESLKKDGELEDSGIEDDLDV